MQNHNLKSNGEKIQELRQRTQAGLLDCKKALEASGYEIEAAIEWLKTQGIAKAAKKSGNISAEGVIAIAENNQAITMYELNCQTDFVAKNQDFKDLSAQIGQILVNNEFETLEAALNLTNENDQTINELTVNLTSVLGEKIVLRRAIFIKKAVDEVVGHYVHNNHKIGAIIVLSGGNVEVARNLSMHLASMNPEYLDEHSIPKATIEDIKTKIYNSSILENKPQNIKDNIAKGLLSKKLSELTLVDQEFVMEKGKVKDYLSRHHAKAIAMYRFELAEGIEKKQENFAQEVAAQMRTVKED